MYTILTKKKMWQETIMYIIIKTVKLKINEIIITSMSLRNYTKNTLSKIFDKSVVVTFYDI